MVEPVSLAREGAREAELSSNRLRGTVNKKQTSVVLSKEDFRVKLLPQHSLRVNMLSI